MRFTNNFNTCCIFDKVVQSACDFLYNTSCEWVVVLDDVVVIFTAITVVVLNLNGSKELSLKVTHRFILYLWMSPHKRISECQAPVRNTCNYPEQNTIQHENIPALRNFVPVVSSAKNSRFTSCLNLLKSV